MGKNFDFYSGKHSLMKPPFYSFVVFGARCFQLIIICLALFHEGFKQYSYLESPTNIPIAVWVFDFPDPHGQIDTSFNAKVVDKEIIDNFLDTSKGGIKNALQFFLLDGQIIKGMKLISLHPDAMELFHGTIRKQLAMDYDMSDFTSCLAGFFTRTTRELFEMGRRFRHK